MPDLRWAFGAYNLVISQTVDSRLVTRWWGEEGAEVGDSSSSGGG